MYLSNLRLSLILIHPLPQEEQEEQEEEEEEMYMTASVCLFVCVIGLQLLDTYVLNPGLITIILIQTFESCLPLILIHLLPPCSHYSRCN